MAVDKLPPLLPPSVSKILGWSSIYFLLAVGAFTFPLMPAPDLDPSWRMALGYFFENGMQFGRDVVFTYGPLGFVMGKTYSGVQFWSLIIGQLGLALISAAVIVNQGRRLSGHSRTIFFIFFLFFGITYEDALHMLVIALLGFELLRIGGEPWKHRTALIAVILAVYGQIKFTDLLLASFIVLLVLGYNLWRRRRLEAALLGLVYIGAFLGIWVGFGQGLSNLPDYFYGSWQISQGYQWAMGFPSPVTPLWMALVILFILAGYVGLHLFINPDKPRAVVNALLLTAYLYLNWKHGFVRADGHMIGFFFCALLPITAYPTLLDDPDRLSRSHRWVFAGLLLLSLCGVENALSGVVRESLGIMQAKIYGNISSVIKWSDTRQYYRDRLAMERNAADLHQTRKIVGNAPLDVLGFEQGVAIFNKFNYRPRPVIQSYSTFTPALTKMNGDFFASNHAPEYVLLKIQAIDYRLPTMDDAQVLLILVQRYSYLRTEKGYQLWKRNPGPFDPASVLPRLLRTTTVEVNRPLVIKDLASQPLWLRADLQPSLLGSLRSFLYKPPQVRLDLEDSAGKHHEYLMPLPQGRTGFILNPMIEDIVDYMYFASSKPQKLVHALTLKIDPSDEKYFARSARIELSALPSASSGEAYFASQNSRLFQMFKTVPIFYDSYTPLSKSVIDGMEVAILHAPSQMIFELPPDAKTISGKFGLMPGTYLDGGKTNGAEFIVYWSNGSSRVELYRKYLDPVKKEDDRGLHEFSAKLEGLSGGKLYLEVDPGPFKDTGWDWTGWTDILIE